MENQQRKAAIDYLYPLKWVWLNKNPCGIEGKTLFSVKQEPLWG